MLTIFINYDIFKLLLLMTSDVSKKRLNTIYKLLKLLTHEMGLFIG